jgi:hypothetical protein
MAMLPLTMVFEFTTSKSFYCELVMVNIDLYRSNHDTLEVEIVYMLPSTILLFFLHPLLRTTETHTCRATFIRSYVKYYHILNALSTVTVWILSTGSS